MSPAKTILGVIIIALVLLGAAFFSIWRINPPRADESSPKFQRMMHNIERFTQDIRFVGTANHALVRDEIIAEIEAMGLTPTIHRTRAYLRDSLEARLLIFEWHNYEANAQRIQNNRNNMQGLLQSASARYRNLFPGHPWGEGGYIYVDNILVTLPAARSNAGGIMFVSHYDTMERTLGAADATTPVAAMLEALRAHSQNSNLANNLHFLFTDAEEVAALGAFAFSRDFPNMISEVDLLINLEAVGNSGGLLNFQTSATPYAMVRLFNRAVPRPIGFHWGDWVYTTQMPGSYTDFTVFREYGFRGLNFAILGGHEHYHTMTDTFENLNPNTAYHFLVTVMGLADYTANNSLASLNNPSQEAIFFTFLPGNMLVLTVTTANILAGLSFAIALAFLVYRFKAKMEKCQLITAILMILIIATTFVLLFISTLSYLFWMPMLFISTSAFLKKWKLVYKTALTVSVALTLLLWVPPIYLLLLLFG